MTRIFLFVSFISTRLFTKHKPYIIQLMYSYVIGWVCKYVPFLHPRLSSILFIHPFRLPLPSSLYFPAQAHFLYTQFLYILLHPFLPVLVISSPASTRLPSQVNNTSLRLLRSRVYDDKRDDIFCTCLTDSNRKNCVCIHFSGATWSELVFVKIHAGNGSLNLFIKSW